VDNNIHVLYPHTTTPYQKAYQQIIEGLRYSTSQPLSTLSIPKEYDLNKAQRWIDNNSSSPGYLIVLGQHAYQVSGLLKHKHHLLTGALDILPGNNRISGVSIHIDPSVYLDHLSIISPNTTKLVVFYKIKNKYLLPLIENAAQKHSVEISPIPVTNIETAVRRIASTLKFVNPDNTAIWFTRNVIGLNTELLLPLILDTSWHRRIPVFSGMISHTKRGFLFSLYPDYRGMGKELGEAIIQHIQGNKNLSSRFTKATNFILNTRTAQHLGISIDDSTLERVDVTFPAK
jgi:putative ABC transport system substrate-binding protein